MYRSQGIRTKINIIVLLLTLGATVAAVAPFLHILFPKESQVEVFGFRNARTFCYSLGMPITIFVSALIMSFIVNFIKDTPIYKTIQNVCIVFLSVATYYILWTFSAFSDFDPLFYYIMIILVSISFGILINRFLRFTSSSTNKLLKVQSNIPNLDKRIRTVNDIASIMPDDNEDIVTYKAMVDVTGDNLKETITEIKKDLN